MSIKYDKLTIRVSELQTQNVTCPPWETLVLRAIYGDNVQVVGTREVSRAKLDAKDEFARLAVRYGPKNAEVPTVAAVYGNFGPGVKALADEMQRSQEEVAPEALNVDILESAEAGLTEEQIDAIVTQGNVAQGAALAAGGEGAPVVDPNQSSKGPGAGAPNPGDPVSEVIPGNAAADLV